MTLLTILKNHRGPVSYTTDMLTFTTSQPKLTTGPTLLSFDKPNPRLA